MIVPRGGGLRSRGWSSTFAQALVGYTSAVIGLACELLIAVKYGATSDTDAYRWSGLASLYVNNIIVVTILPVLLRSRLHLRGPKQSVLCRSLRDQQYRFSLWVKVVVTVIGLMWIAACVAFFLRPSPGMLFVMGVLLALSFMAFSVISMPAFYNGFPWVNIAANALVNGIVLLCVVRGHANFILIAGLGMAVGGLTLLASILPWQKFYNTTAFKAWLDSIPIAAVPEGVGVAAAPAVSLLAQTISASLYYGALSRAGVGLLSLFTLAQKGGLLLAIPGTALFNRYLQHERQDEHEAGDPDDRAALGALPMLCVAPLFAGLSFAVLCHVYRITILSHAALLMARATASSAGFYPLSLGAAMLSVSRRAAKLTILPSIAGCICALGAAALMFAHNGSLWLLGAPAAATGVASAGTMAWVAVRSGKFPVAAGLSLMASLATVVGVSALLSSGAVELGLEHAVQAAVHVVRTLF